MTKANECTCPSGDGSLRHPCPAHPAAEQAGGDERAAFRPAQVISYRPGVGEVTIYVAGRVPGYMNIGDTVYVSDRAPVEQAGEDERVIGWRERILAAHPNSDPGFWPDALLVEHMAAEIADLRAALAQPSPVSEALIYACKNLAQITSSDGSGHADIAMAVLRMAGVGDDERERLVNEWKAARAWKPSPAQAEAEAERPEVVAWRYGFSGGIVSDKACLDEWKSGGEYQSLMTVAQHERIVGELRAVIAQLRQHKNDYMDSGQQTYRALQNEIREREAEIARLDGLVSGRTAERDAALARVAELEKQEPVATVARVPGEDWNGLHFYRDLQGMQPGTKLYAAPVAQAQHSVPDELRAICMLVAETGIKYGRGRHRAVAADECRAVVNAVLNADLSVGRACEYAGCCDKAHPGTSLCIAHHSKKAREQLLAAAPGKEGV
ncbi:hypothetical protein ACM71U_08875 [Pseudomonas aeruginosa]